MNTRLWTALALLLLAGPSSAVVLSLQPSVSVAMPGDTVTLELTISGLDDGGAPSLGAFDIDISYDDSAISFLGASFGTSLGDEGLFEAFTDIDDSVGGLVNLAEVSLLSVAGLNALQDDSFVLASLDFMVDVLPLGSSTIVGFGDTLLGDAFGDRLLEDALEQAIIRNPSGVTEPASLLLWALGLFGLVVSRSRIIR